MAKKREVVPPSHVFARRLRETREDRRLKQGQLAEAMTKAGRPMDRTAVIRMEKIPPERVVSLDEMLAFAKVLGIAPALLVSPPDGEHVWTTNGNPGYTGPEFRNWFIWGDPQLPDLVRERMDLAFDLEEYVPLIRGYFDASRSGDEDARLKASERVMKTLIEHYERVQEIAAEREEES